jgi:hypothetical protein
MPSYKDPQFTEACKSLSKNKLIREALRDEFGKNATDILRILSQGKSLPLEFQSALDAVMDILTNEAPVVKQFEAEQDKGVYSIQIRGFAGAYFVSAAEYGDSEIFASRKHSEDYVQQNFGEFISD